MPRATRLVRNVRDNSIREFNAMRVPTVAVYIVHLQCGVVVFPMTSLVDAGVNHSESNGQAWAS